MEQEARAFRWRRGSTLIEVVLAGVLLSLVAGSVFAAISQTLRAEARQRHRLAAHELAGRIMLQYIDSPKGLPDEGAPYDDGVYRFRWALSGEDVRVKAEADKVSALFDKTRLLRVKVYAGVEAGGGTVQRGEQLAEIVRMYNRALILSRNDDSKGRGLLDQDTLKEFLDTARSAGGAPVPPREGGGK